jgi:flagellar basal-body rod protein FlgB
MSWMDTALLKHIEHYVDLAAFREKLVAGNIANIDTPHYRALDVDFRTELRRAMAGFENDPGPAMVREVPGLIERPDGNNVSMDRETMLLAATQLQFRIGIELLREHYHLLLTSIREGS